MCSEGLSGASRSQVKRTLMDAIRTLTFEPDSPGTVDRDLVKCSPDVAVGEELHNLDTNHDDTTKAQPTEFPSDEEVVPALGGSVPPQHRRVPGSEHVLQ